jgi:D-glycero-alpha-D-manno-heptose-7-phosphate kinase
LEFAGGGTDVPPYTDTDGGLIFNATINRFAYCTISPRDDNEININSLDYGIIAFVEHCELDLVKAIIKRMKNYADVKGINITLYSDVPAGSGLGSSSTVCVAMVSAIARYYNLNLERCDIANIAYEIERLELGIAGGLQDQYAAAFGGFSLMEFGKNLSVIVNPYNISEDIRNELSLHLILINTNKMRMSDKILREQISVMDNVKTYYLKAKLLANLQKNAIIENNCFQFGTLLDEAWFNKKKMCNTITNDFIDKCYDTAKEFGAISGRIMGAGGGGHMLFYVHDLSKRRKVIQALEDIGCSHVPFDFETKGVTTWITRS